MIDYCHSLMNELDDRITELTYEHSNNSLELYENAIVLVLQRLDSAKEYVKKKGFKDEDEEIFFFKQLKPYRFLKSVGFPKNIALKTFQRRKFFLRKGFINQIQK